jgi:hypothetical protein
MTRIVAYRRVKTVGSHQPEFSGLNTFKVGSTCYLCISPAYLAYASMYLRSATPQGSILGSNPFKVTTHAVSSP